MRSIWRGMSLKFRRKNKNQYLIKTEYNLCETFCVLWETFCVLWETLCDSYNTELHEESQSFTKKTWKKTTFIFYISIYVYNMSSSEIQLSTKAFAKQTWNLLVPRNSNLSERSRKTWNPGRKTRLSAVALAKEENTKPACPVKCDNGAYFIRETRNLFYVNPENPYVYTFFLSVAVSISFLPF